MPEVYLPRFAEKEVLLSASFSPAVVIVGPRQVGKTSLTTAIRNQVTRPSLYLDLERPRDLAFISDLEGFAERNLNHLIILDEIQHRKDLFPQLRSVIDRNREPGRFILLGSASPELIRDSSESLAGRIAIIELSGLRLDEVADYADFKKHWFRGGFPKSLLADSDETSSRWRENFITSYIQRELPLLGLRADPNLVRRLLGMLSHINAQTLNKTNLANSLDLSPKTLSNYLDFLEQAYLIRRLPPYFVNVGKRLVKAPKIYLRDTGILHELLGVQHETGLIGHPSVGASWENYIIEQLHIIKPRWAHLYYYRTQAGAELDLVITRGGIAERTVEIKYSVNPTLTKGFYTANEDLGINKMFVVAAVEKSYTLKNKVEVITPRELHRIFE